MKKSGLLKRKIVGKELSSEQPAEKEEKPVLWGEAVRSLRVLVRDPAAPEGPAVIMDGARHRLLR